MTIQTCNISPLHQAYSALQTLPHNYAGSGSWGDSAYCRYIAGITCLIGLGLFSIMQIPTPAMVPSFLGPTPVMEDDITHGDFYSFHPANDLGLPIRREASGTR